MREMGTICTNHNEHHIQTVFTLVFEHPRAFVFLELAPDITADLPVLFSYSINKNISHTGIFCSWSGIQLLNRDLRYA